MVQHDPGGFRCFWDRLSVMSKPLLCLIGGNESSGLTPLSWVICLLVAGFFDFECWRLGPHQPGSASGVSGPLGPFGGATRGTENLPGGQLLRVSCCWRTAHRPPHWRCRFGPTGQPRQSWLLRSGDQRRTRVRTRRLDLSAPGGQSRP